MMNKHWQLRDEWYRTFHNWPVLAACFLLGGLLGWGAGMIWPAYSRAAQEIYVALNPYRAYSDAEFLALAKPRYSNLDNYHYWQMNQLEAAIFRSELLRSTLDGLRAEDPYWNDIDAAGLRAMLDTDWRTAGAWQLSAIHRDERRARQALAAWSARITADVPQAVEAARQAFIIDAQLSEAGRALAEMCRRQEALAQAEQGLQAWQTAAAGLPAGEPLPAEARWQVYALTTANAVDAPAWEALLQSQPQPQAPAGEFLAWSEAVSAQIGAELAELPAALEAQAAQVQALQGQYRQAADASLGLSPNIAIESLGDVRVRQERPASMLALIGAFLGMLAWLMWRLALADRRAAGAAAVEAGRSPGS